MAHDPHPAHLTRRHLLQLLGAGAGIGLLPRGAAALAQSGRGAAAARVEDWPEVGGKGRLNVWNETGILETFPADGLKVLWRTPIQAGYTGPAVADGRVFVLDWQDTKLPFGTERALALDEKTGEAPLDAGVAGRLPRHLVADRTARDADGRRRSRLRRRRRRQAVLPRREERRDPCGRRTTSKDYGADRRKWAFDWGFASAPLVDGGRLIALVDGRPDAKVVAFDKMTGKEIWRALIGRRRISASRSRSSSPPAAPGS